MLECKYVQSGSFRKKKAAVAIIVAKCVSNGWRRVQSDPDLWRHIIFFLLTETNSHCNGFYSHNDTPPKIYPSVEQNSSAPLFLAFHVAAAC